MERTVDDEDDPKDVGVEVARRVLRCLWPRVPHVGEPERRDADQQQRDYEHAHRPLLVCNAASTTMSWANFASRSERRTEREVAQALDLQDRLEVDRQQRQEVEHHLNARRELDLQHDTCTIADAETRLHKTRRRAHAPI